MMLPALGIDLGGTKASAVLLATDGSLLWQHRLPTPAGDYSATLHTVAALVASGRAHAQAHGLAAPSIGVGSPGTEDLQSASRRMKNCNSTCLNGQPLRADLQALLGQRIALVNDANCLAWSEATDGAGAGAEVVFAVILGTGAGAGIAVHGQVLTGPNGLAGEWGHNPLPWVQDEDLPLPHCYCGQRGCIETFVSGTGLAADYRWHAEPGGSYQTGQPSLSAHSIALAAAAGDAAAQASLQRHSRRLARALAGVINLLDPDVIVLGGGLSGMPHLLQQLPGLWAPWVFAAGGVAGGVAQVQPVRTRLATALHGDDSGVRGAAWAGRDLALKAALNRGN